MAQPCRLLLISLKFIYVYIYIYIYIYRYIYILNKNLRKGSAQWDDNMLFPKDQIIWSGPAGIPNLLETVLFPNGDRPV